MSLKSELSTPENIKVLTSEQKSTKKSSVTKYRVGLSRKFKSPVLDNKNVDNLQTEAINSPSSIHDQNKSVCKKFASPCVRIGLSRNYKRASRSNQNDTSEIDNTPPIQKTFRVSLSGKFKSPVLETVNIPNNCEINTNKLTPCRIGLSRKFKTASSMPNTADENFDTITCKSKIDLKVNTKEIQTTNLPVEYKENSKRKSDDYDISPIKHKKKTTEKIIVNYEDDCKNLATVIKDNNSKCKKNELKASAKSKKKNVEEKIDKSRKQTKENVHEEKINKSEKQTKENVDEKFLSPKIEKPNGVESLLTADISKNFTTDKNILIPLNENNNINSNSSKNIKESFRKRLSLKKTCSSIETNEDSIPYSCSITKLIKHSNDLQKNAIKDTSEIEIKGFSLEDDFQPSSTLIKVDSFDVATEIKLLKNRIKTKENELCGLKQAATYKKLHNVVELTKLTEVWKTGCKSALQDLLKGLQNHTPINMTILLQNLKIPKEIFSCNVEGELI